MTDLVERCPESLSPHGLHFWSAWYRVGKQASRHCQYCDKIETVGEVDSNE